MENGPIVAKEDGHTKNHVTKPAPNLNDWQQWHSKNRSISAVGGCLSISQPSRPEILTQKLLVTTLLGQLAHAYF